MNRNREHENIKSRECEKRQELIDISIRLLKLGLVVRTWGNMSIRLDDKHILITPSGMRYEELEPKDIVCVEIEGGKTITDSCFVREPSSELPVHLAYYKAMPDTKVVMHTHQPYGSALSLYGEDIDVSVELTKYIDSPVLPISEYGISGSSRLHDNVEKKIKSSGSGVILMEKHGVLARGTDVGETIAMLERLEKWCKEKYRETLKQALESEDKKREITDGEILPYLDDFAQICGVSMQLQDTALPYTAHDGCETEEFENEIFRGVDPRDLESAKYIFSKNLMARAVGIARGVPPLTHEEAEAMREKYVESYSKKADDKGKIVQENMNDVNETK